MENSSGLCRFYKTLVEKSSDPLVVNQEGIIVYANPAAAEELGFSVDDLINANVRDFLPPSLLEKVEDLYQKRIKGQNVPKVYEVTLKRIDGKYVPFEMSVELIDYNESPAVLATFRNVEERKKAEKINEDKYKRLRNMLNKKDVGIFESTIPGTITYVNKSFAKLLGYKNPDELIKKKATILYAFPEERDKLIEELKKKKEIHNKIVTFVKANGKLEQYELTEFLQNKKIMGFLWKHNMNKREEDLIIVCSYCRKFKNGEAWLQPDEYMRHNKAKIKNSDFDFSHGVCGDCKEELAAKL